MDIIGYVSLSIYFESPSTGICGAVNIDAPSTGTMETGQITCYKAGQIVSSLQY